MSYIFGLIKLGVLWFKGEVEMEQRKLNGEKEPDMDMRGKSSLEKWGLNIPAWCDITALLFSPRVAPNLVSSWTLHTSGWYQHQCPATFCPLSHSPTPHLHPVNHASQIAPWSQSTLKWWKWIKLITDSQRESWPGIKSCVWPSAVHPSAVLYDGRPGRVPAAFWRQSPSIHTYRAPRHPLLTLPPLPSDAPCVLVLSDI